MISQFNSIESKIRSTFQRILSRTYNNKLLLLSLMILVFAFSQTIGDVNAQSETNWSDPTNLSNSGSTESPFMVADTQGVIHVIWNDELDGYVYTQRSEVEQWSTPVPVSFPFQVEDSIPLLLADSNGYVHAFWTDEDNALFYSGVPGSEFGNAGAWQSATGLAESALDFDVIIDDTGSLHLSYIRSLSSDQFPSGIYYRKSINGGQSWTESISLYTSKYYRRINQNNTHVQISSIKVNEDIHIYVAWDDRPIRKVFMTHSLDGGSTWEDDREIADPTETPGITPFNLMLSPGSSSLLSIIQKGTPGLYCTQESYLSNDQGTTWSGPIPIFPEVAGCPQENRFFTLDNGLTILHAIIHDQIYLTAWDGQSWSTPQKQSATYSVQNTFSTVAFVNRMTSMMGNKFYVVGNDDASNFSDVWIMSRPVGAIRDWYPSPTTWSSPEMIVSNPTAIADPIILADADGNFHGLWLEFPEDRQGLSIHYARYSNDQWSSPVSIFSEAYDHAASLSAAIDSRGRILLSWIDLPSGNIYFSWANVDQAINPSEWSEPHDISSSNSYQSSPYLTIDELDNIFVVYAIPINEGRGIYLTRSNDGGDSWSQPTPVVDAASEGWEIVDTPKILTSNDEIFAIWTRNSLANNGRPIELYYSSSDAESLDWSSPELIGENTPLWIEIAGVGGTMIHRAWLEKLDGHLLLTDQISNDFGSTWNTPTNISNFSTIDGTLELIKAPDNTLHLVHLGESYEGHLRLIYWAWENQEWKLIEDIDLGQAIEAHVNSLSISINDEGKLMVLYLISNNGEIYGETTYELNHLSRQVILSLLVPTPTPEAAESTPTNQLALTATSTTEPTAKPTDDLSIAQNEPDDLISNDLVQQQSANNNLRNLVIGLVLATILFVIAFGLLVRKLVTRKDH